MDVFSPTLINILLLFGTEALSALFLTVTTFININTMSFFLFVVFVVEVMW